MAGALHAMFAVAVISFHPKDHDIVCIVGRGIFRLCRLIEGVLKPFGFAKGDFLNCFAHDWLSPRYFSSHATISASPGRFDPCHAPQLG